MTTGIPAGGLGHTYQYEVAAARGTTETSPSSPVTITMPASEPTAEAPTNITVTPSQGTTSFSLSWSRPSGNPNDSSISGYEVFWHDANSSCPNQVPSEAQTSATSYTITGLVSGHMHHLAVASVNAAGAGAWGGAPAAFAGHGAPAAPTISAASNTQLTWPCVPFASGYWIYSGTVTPPNPIIWTRLPLEVPCGWNSSLQPGLYAVTAANGTLESPKSNQVVLPPPVAAPIRASGTARLAGSINWLAWVPAWLRADPNAPLTRHGAMPQA